MQIATPEGVTLELVLAGAGSRAAAALVDLIIQVLGAALLSGLVLVAVLLLGWPLALAAAVGAVIAFLDRRLVLTWDGRRRLGELLAGSMRGKVPVDTRTLDDETFLAALVEARDVRT